MLTEIFYNILMLSLAGAILFFLVLILRPVTKKVFSPYLNYSLVIITLVTFMVPYGKLMPSFENPISNMPKLIEEKSIVNENKQNEIINHNIIHTKDKSEKIQQDKISKDNTVNETMIDKKNTVKIFNFLKNNVGFIWLFGSIIFVISQLVGVISFKKKLKISSRIVQNEEVKALFYECCNQLEINKEIPLMVCENIGTPMTTGLFKTKITIPTEEFDLNMLKMIFKHELIHYKRKDLWVKVFSFFSLVLHWFNPVIYLVNRELNKACELSCDFQVVKDMNVEDKKHYGLAILKVIDNSLNRKITLGVAMSDGSKNQLKERLGMIKSVKKPKKLTSLVALTTAVALTITGAFVSSALGQTKDNKSSNDFAVMVKNKSLNAVNLSDTSKEVIIDKGGVFKNPKISPNGDNVAYTKGESLYIAPIDLKQNSKRISKISDKIVSYTWGTTNDLVYSTENGGLNGFSLKNKKISNYIKTKERYEDIEGDKKGNIYGSVYNYYTKDGQQYIKAKGLIKYDMKLGKENLLIKAKPWSDENPSSSLVPKVAGISKDGDYVYVWRKAQSGSLNADGVHFGVYDVKGNKFIPSNDEQVFALAYEDNLAINPINAKMPVLNNGGARNMNINKTIGIVDVINGTFKAILPDNMISLDGQYGSGAKGMVTMTPSFSPDGKKVIYAASNANDDMQEWEKSAHNIYIVDVNTKKVEKITKGNSFDFAPKYILKGKSVVFARRTGENMISLISLKGNKETCITKDIKLGEYSWYYGHYKLGESLDIYTN